MKILGQAEIEVLNIVKGRICKDAVIAGGAVRDMVFEKPYKDIDIFIPSSTSIVNRYGWGYLMDECLPDIFPNPVEVVNQDEYDFHTGEDELGLFVGTPVNTFRVLETKFNGTKYQLIFHPKFKPEQPGTLFITFDFNCNMLSFDGVSVFKSAAFKTFQKTKLLTTHHPKLLDSDIKRLDQLKLKYPDWGISDALKSKLTERLKSTPEQKKFIVSFKYKINV